MFNNTNIKIHTGLSLHVQMDILASDFYWDYTNTKRITKSGAESLNTLINHLFTTYGEYFGIEQIVNYILSKEHITDVELCLQSDETIRDLLCIIYVCNTQIDLRHRIQYQWFIRKLLQHVLPTSEWYLYLIHTPVSKWGLLAKRTLHSMACTSADDVMILKLLRSGGIESNP